MGTNFYMMTSDKEAANEWFEDNYELTDYPQWGYSIHIAKTSGGWKPLFQEHSRIHSVNDIKIIIGLFLVIYIILCILVSKFFNKHHIF